MDMRQQATSRAVTGTLAPARNGYAAPRAHAAGSYGVALSTPALLDARQVGCSREPSPLGSLGASARREGGDQLRTGRASGHPSLAVVQRLAGQSAGALHG